MYISKMKQSMLKAVLGLSGALGKIMSLINTMVTVKERVADL